MIIQCSWGNFCEACYSKAGGHDCHPFEICKTCGEWIQEPTAMVPSDMCSDCYEELEESDNSQNNMAPVIINFVCGLIGFLGVGYFALRRFLKGFLFLISGLILVRAFFLERASKEMSMASRNELCPNCLFELTEPFEDCSQCGTKLNLCSSCNTLCTSDDVSFCEECEEYYCYEGGCAMPCECNANDGDGCCTGYVCHDDVYYLPCPPLHERGIYKRRIIILDSSRSSFCPDCYYKTNGRTDCHPFEICKECSDVIVEPNAMGPADLCTSCSPFI